MNFANSLRNSDTIKDIFQRLNDISQEISREEEINRKAENYRKIQEYKAGAKEFPLKEFIDQLGTENHEAALKEIIGGLVRLKFSFKDVLSFFDQLDIWVPKYLLSSHYILISIETIEKNKWPTDKDWYVVLGNMGVGKSSFIHFLQDNVEPHLVTCSESWSLKPKVFKNPLIHTKLVDAETIIPWKNEIVLNRKNVYIYDTPGFHITDSYEQEIVSSLALKQALANIK